MITTARTAQEVSDTLTGHLRNALQMLSLARSESGVTDVYLMLPAIEERIRKAVEIATELQAGVEGWQRFYIERFIKERV